MQSTWGQTNAAIDSRNTYEYFPLHVNMKVIICLVLLGVALVAARPQAEGYVAPAAEEVVQAEVPAAVEAAIEDVLQVQEPVVEEVVQVQEPVVEEVVQVQEPVVEDVVQVIEPVVQAVEEVQAAEPVVLASVQLEVQEVESASAEDVRSYANTGYSWAYAISDEDSEDRDLHFGHKESRTDDSNTTRGSYYINLPDSRTLLVSYYVDQDGFHPTITYEGEAVHA